MFQNQKYGSKKFHILELRIEIFKFWKIFIFSIIRKYIVIIKLNYEKNIKFDNITIVIS
jgi:hypothetical protein